MQSLSDPAEQGQCDSARPQPDQDGSRNQADCPELVSPFEDQYDDDSTTNVDLSGTDTLLADGRPGPQGTTTTTTTTTTTSSDSIHGSSFPFHQTTSSPSEAGHADGDHEQGNPNLSNVADGPALDQAPSAAQGDEAEKSDDGHSEVAEAGLTDAQQQTDNNDPISSPHPLHPLHPLLNFNGPPNFPSHLHTLYVAGLMMGTEVPDAAWGLGSWPVVTGNISPQEANPMAEANNTTPGFGDAADALPPVQLSNPNPAIPGSENLGLVDFLHNWAQQESYTHAPQPRPPHYDRIVEQARTNVTEVYYSDLSGDFCDFQALNWVAMGISRDAARVRRCRTYKNYVNRPGSDVLTLGSSFTKPHLEDAGIPSHESFFRFRKMVIRQDVQLAHFQLRSVLACPSRTFAFYPSPTGINRMNTASRKTDCVMSMREFPSMGGALSALDAGCGVLVGGTFNGDYYVKPLDCDDKTKFTEGQITSDFSGITNHISVYRPRRSSGPVAAIASNDCGFRTLDLTTENFTSETMYGFALNCSALSPDHRLRVVVGDHSSVLITNADTGEILQQLSGHRDYGFACDWSEDGWTVATGFQDRGVKIWDARKWCNSSGVSTPLCTLRSEMASVRGLRFSPLGSGRPVLVAAEEADFVNLIDAQTFSSKQTMDVFGEIGGVSFTNEGHDLTVLCCDAHRGGLLQLERCGRRPEPILDHVWQQNTSQLRHFAEREEDRDDFLGREDWCRSRRPNLLDKELEPF
ncbi:hypothetical protein E4U41_001410 [Claviceps citrina]|nr:hypothetical protein E4U41_001410 [Claviceps citrina]